MLMPAVAIFMCVDAAADIRIMLLLLPLSAVPMVVAAMMPIWIMVIKGHGGVTSPLLSLLKMRFSSPFDSIQVGKWLIIDMGSICSFLPLPIDTCPIRQHISHRKNGAGAMIHFIAAVRGQ
jgi:hypothetical protein